MSVINEVRGLFNPQAVAEAIEKLPEQKTTIMDLLFSKRINHDFPTIAFHELDAVIGTQPLARRDGPPIAYQGRGEEARIYAPSPLKPSVDITAAELNDLRAIWGNQSNRQNFVNRKVDQLRRLIRNSTEGIASVVATTGTLSWPRRIEGGGYEDFKLEFGDIKISNPAAAWDDAVNPPGLAEVYGHLSDLEQTVAESGGGGEISFLAGKTAFKALMKLADRWRSTVQGSPITLKFENGAINIGGYEVRGLAERYQSPLDGSFVDKIPPDVLIGYARDHSGAVYYLAIDSISLNNKAVPFHIVVEPVPGDASLRLIAQAKPVPSRGMDSLIKSKVTN